MNVKVTYCSPSEFLLDLKLQTCFIFRYFVFDRISREETGNMGQERRAANAGPLPDSNQGPYSYVAFAVTIHVGHVGGWGLPVSVRSVAMVTRSVWV